MWSFHPEIPSNQLGLEITNLVEPLQVLPRYNGAPGQEHWVRGRSLA